MPVDFMKEIILNGSIRELRLSLVFDDACSAGAKFAEAAEVLKGEGAKPICLEVFSARWAKDAVEKFKGEFSGKFPVNWICPLDEAAKPVLASAHITAIAGADVEFKQTDGGSVAVSYDDGYARYVRTFGVVTPLHNGDGYLHTRENLKELEKAIAQFGCKYTDIARTWFYNDDILSWYDSFNKARTEFYEEVGIFKSLLPASTGIGAPNPSGSKITSGAIALLPSAKGTGFKVCEVDSPLQCGAPKYGSSFSRAVEISTPAARRIFISGTASIAPGGATEHVGDIEKQVELTMDVINGILQSRGMSFADTAHSVIYCLRPEYFEVFKRWLGVKGYSFPHCPSYSIVCRHDLLFEVELEAVKQEA